MRFDTNEECWRHEDWKWALEQAAVVGDNDFSYVANIYYQLLKNGPDEP